MRTIKEFNEKYYDMNIRIERFLRNETPYYEIIKLWKDSINDPYPIRSFIGSANTIDEAAQLVEDYFEYSVGGDN